MCKQVLLLVSLGLAPLGALGQTIDSTDPKSAAFVGLLRRPEVRGELDLVDYQVEEIEKLIAQRAQIGSGFARKVSMLPLPERRPFFEQTQQELALLDQQVIKLLLPKQIDRLRQIDLQIAVQADAPNAGLTNKKLVEALGLSVAQTQAIEAEAAELEAKLKEKIEALKKEVAKAKDEARREVLKHLTEEQRAEYQRLVGPVIDRN
jgi:hypothetical protein